MENIKIRQKDQMVMSLVHYFVTKESYTPIIVKGAKDEVWLENLEAPIKIIRINSNYIHNDEQYNFDVNKFSFVLNQIKRKTFTFKIKALNICLDVDDRVNLNPFKSIESISFKKITDIINSENLKVVFPNIETDLIVNNDNLEILKTVTDDINETTSKKNKIFEDVFKSKKIIITYAIIVLCSLIYALSIFLPSINFFGANNGTLVKGGDYYRLITSVFLHANIIHLVVNMYSLKVLGSELENYVGKLKFLGIFLISGLFGSLFSVLLNNNLTFSVGASGAIFGLASALIYFGYYYRVYLNSVLIKELLPIIFINLLIGFFVSGIDNAAHIGGIVGGYLAISALGIKGKTNLSEQKNGIIALITLSIFMIYLIFR